MNEVTIEEEIANPTAGKPHVLLLGAGASKAALPDGDKNGKPVPVLREVAEELNLVNYFPKELQDLAVKNFEQAYSQLFEMGNKSKLKVLDNKIRSYFSSLELPDKPNLYDIINMSLREKDAIFTFNWDPFLMQSRIRLAKAGLAVKQPKLFFLHGNVMVGFCKKDKTCGVADNKCSRCNKVFQDSELLYPVEKKNYQKDPFIKNEWEAVQGYLKHCFMFTVFGYSAPQTDKEAIDLLKKGWGDVNIRNMEQTEIISRFGSDHDELEEKWGEFKHTHHYDIFDSFFDSFIAKHPRRSIEAYWNQYWEAKFISNNTVPQNFSGFQEMKEWYRPLIEAEIGREK